MTEIGLLTDRVEGGAIKFDTRKSQFIIIGPEADEVFRGSLKDLIRTIKVAKSRQASRERTAARSSERKAAELGTTRL